MSTQDVLFGGILVSKKKQIRIAALTILNFWHSPGVRQKGSPDEPHGTRSPRNQNVQLGRGLQDWFVGQCGRSEKEVEESLLWARKHRWQRNPLLLQIRDCPCSSQGPTIRRWPSRTGLVTSSILFLKPFTVKDHCFFIITPQNQSLHQLFLMASLELRA